MGCIFCKIASHEINSKIVYETEEVIAFRDTNPQSPEHVLIVPKKHIESLETVGEDERALLGGILIAAREIAAKLGLKNGYRVVANCGEDAGQAVYHLHFHLLGGRHLGWPPG